MEDCVVFNKVNIITTFTYLEIMLLLLEFIITVMEFIIIVICGYEDGIDMKIV